MIGLTTSVKNKYRLLISDIDQRKAQINHNQYNDNKHNYKYNINNNIDYNNQYNNEHNNGSQDHNYHTKINWKTTKIKETKTRKKEKDTNRW